MARVSSIGFPTRFSHLGFGKRPLLQRGHEGSVGCRRNCASGCGGSKGRDDLGSVGRVMERPGSQGADLDADRTLTASPE